MVKHYLISLLIGYSPVLEMDSLQACKTAAFAIHKYHVTVTREDARIAYCINAGTGETILLRLRDKP